MRILHVVPTYAPAWRYGGPIVSVHGLCKALVGRGHQVSVYTTNVDGPGELEVPVAQPVDVDGVAVTYFECNGPRRLFWSAGLRAALDHHMSEFDLVHAHACFLLPPTWAARAARKAGVPYVFSPRGMLVPELISQRSAWIKRAWIRLVDRQTLREAAAVHVTSQREADDLRRVVPDAVRLSVIANGVELLKAEDPGSSVGKPNILFVGRVNWKKGIDLLIRALPGVPETRLRIVGNDEEGLRPALERLAIDHGVADRVDWLGALYGKAKALEFATASVFVLPSVSENFGNVVLEAMSAGLPVVCSEGVGASELVARSACGLVVERTPEAYAQAISHILSDRILHRSMAAAAIEMSACNSWDMKAAEVDALYQRCLGNSHLANGKYAWRHPTD